ncbi:MAG TPA: GWxTD domain-containing protein [Candidatus Polarisedimenticolaceae bacterium]|nr:GWxTD domain-containing protein [Candidatus Polarisedimenticolaceae bacterium]
MPPQLRLLLVTLPLAVGLADASPTAAASNELKQWIDGPVRYISRKQEAKLFHELETDEARAAFIARFWRRRDPDPETLTNEYRELFWRRVKEANQSFLDSSKQGWMTDRGKIWILYGPPTDVEDYTDLQANDAAGHGVIRWIYEGRPGERIDMRPIVVVPFERQTDGEYRVSYDPQLASVFFDATGIAEGQNDIYDKFFELAGAPRQSELSVMLDLGRMQEVPPAEQVLIESVETMESYGTLELPVAVNHYFRPEDGRPLAVINVELTDLGQIDDAAILARFRPVEPTRETRVLGEDSFRLATAGDYRLAQGRLSLEPGRYDVTVVVADPIHVQTALYKAELDVPETPRTLSLSQPVWAAEMAQVEYRSLASYDEPFHLGPFRVLPLLTATYHRGDSAKLFVETYGAEYPLTATHQLEGLEADGSWVALGQPAVIEQSAAGLAWEVQTGPRWPLGRYRVRVEVVDAAGRTARTEAEFALDEAELDGPAADTDDGAAGDSDS